MRLTAKALAAEVGVSPETVTNIVRDHGYSDVAEFFRVSSRS